MYDIFKKKILFNCYTKSPVPILMHFVDKMAHLFFLKMEALRSESVKTKKNIFEIIKTTDFD